MTNSRRKGQEYERDVNAWGSAIFGTRWTWLNGPGHDGEDFDLAGKLSIEAKNEKRFDLAGWLRQADEQAGPDRLPVVIAKKPGTTSVADHYAIMTCRDFAALFVLLEADR